MCHVEPLGRLGWSLYDHPVKKTETLALTRLAKTFYWRVLFSWFFLKMITRQIPQVHQFISEFLEFHKYTFDTDYYRLFCFWQILFFVCCLLILMNPWVVSGVWTIEKLEYSRFNTNINKEWVHYSTLKWCFVFFR